MDKMEEYKEISTHIRHYSNMRFAQLTLFVAMQTALFAGVFALIDKCEPTTVALLKALGAISTVVFFVMEERAADYWHYFVKRACYLELQLGIECFLNRPSKSVFTATNSVRLLFVAIGIYWVSSFFIN
jgi:hypothetical protein